MEKQVRDVRCLMPRVLVYPSHVTQQISHVPCFIGAWLPCLIGAPRKFLSAGCPDGEGKLRQHPLSRQVCPQDPGGLGRPSRRQILLPVASSRMTPALFRAPVVSSSSLSPVFLILPPLPLSIREHVIALPEEPDGCRDAPVLPQLSSCLLYTSPSPRD